MKEDGGGWALLFLLTSFSFLAPMGSPRVSQRSSPIPSPVLGQSLGLAESPLESRAPNAGCRTGHRSAGEGLLACPLPVLLIPKPLTMKRVGPAAAEPAQRSVCPSNKPL